MSSVETAPSLLEELRAKYGVDESDALHGPSVIVPNRDYRPERTRLLAASGVKTFCGEHEGRVAWVIPLKSKQAPGLPVNNELMNGQGVDDF